MGSEARARIGLLCLLGITLFSFSQLFGEGSYAGPSLLAIAFAMGITAGLRRLGAGASTTMFVSATGLLCYLSWIFEGSSSWFLIPTPTSLRGLFESIGNAWEQASVDYAPVPARPGYVILIAAAMWALTTIGEIATFRWRRPLVASIGAVALFTFVLVVGSRDGAWLLVVLFLVTLFTYWSLEAAHRLRSWGSWVSAWREEHNEPPVLTHSTARRMGGSAILVALVAPLFMPAVGNAVLSWKSGSGEGAGGSGGGGRINPLVSLAPQIVDQAETELFIVRTDNLTRWRINTLDTVEGDEWSPRESQQHNYVSLPEAVEDLAGEERTATFEITGLEGEALPTRYPTKELNILEGGNEEDLRLEATTKDVTLDDGVSEGLTYEVISHEPQVTFRDLMGAEARTAYDGNHLTQLPEELPAEVLELRDEWIEGSDTDFEKLVAIQDRLRGPEFTYDIDIGREQLGEDPEEGHLANFLLESRTGYCQQFATSFALLSRSMGFPTRIAVGFLPGQGVENQENAYVVKGTDAHAWPEVFFEGVGWVSFEPTPRTDVFAAAPAYTSPISDSPDVQVPPDGSNTADDPNAEDPQNGDPRQGREDIVPDVGIDGAGDEQDPAISDTWKKPFARLAAFAVAALVMFLIAVPSLKAWRVKRRYRRATSDAERAAAAFAEFQGEAAELAAQRQRSESAPAYARRVSDLSKIDEARALRLAAIYERAEYGGAGAVSANLADEARRLAGNLRSAMWKRAGWWQRANRLFSPTGLRSGV